MKAYIKNRKRKAGQFQFYMHQFVEAAIARKITPRADVLFDVTFSLKKVLSALSSLRSFIFKKKMPAGAAKATSAVVPASGGNSLRKIGMRLYPWLNKTEKKKAIIVTTTGATFFRNAFPFFYRYEIIPVLWDVWPSTWESLFSDLKLFECKMVFVTARDMARKISEELGIEAHWIPEGIDLGDYDKGNDLSERHVEVYELGRQKKEYHAILEKLHAAGIITHYYRNRYAEDGRLLQLAFPTAEELLEVLSDTKVLVSFPLTDTDPQKSGNLETLTQRYWEAMLSRCLIVGRAPKELIDLIGYDPVVNIDWEKPGEQMEELLKNIHTYQGLVDRNYATALENASWLDRVDKISKILADRNYQL
ncbi:hypothetical protein [Bacteroides heparinolyticus]|uniref:hypothetical protein n=1 Tax=Prevotella heparinolytica TaxID=28113 RepID=UPI003FA146A5